MKVLKKYKFQFVFYLSILFICSISCTQNEEKLVVDFSDTLSVDDQKNDVPVKIAYVAISSITSPKETYSYYSDLLKYISEKIKRPIYIKQKRTYEEVNRLLDNGEVDFAFICSGSYVDEIKRGKIKILVAPVVNAKHTYQSYVITNKNSEIKSFNDFYHKSFAYTDPLSTTGKLYAMKRLKELNYTENVFFKKTVYTYGHDISIQMVNRGIIDGACVHGLIFDYLSEEYPDRVENVKIIEKSEDYGIPPVVVPISMKDECFYKLQNIFLNLHNDSIGKKILTKLHIDKFDVASDSMYKSVYKLKEITDNEDNKNN